MNSLVGALHRFWNPAHRLVSSAGIRVVVASLSALVALGCAALAFRWSYAQVGDDTFITLRYAHHLATGRGLTWNPGEHIEGFSSLVWVALVALGGVLHVDLLAWAKGLSTAMGLTTLLVACAGVWRMRGRLGPFDAAALTVASTALPLWYWTPSGMETPLAGLLVTASAVAYGWGPSPFARGRLVAFVLAGVLCWTRPEGVLPAAALVAIDLWVVAWHRPPLDRATLRSWGLPYAVLAAMLVALVGFRLAYFGDVIPNTGHAKLGDPHRYDDGLAYVRSFWRPATGLLAVGVLAPLGLAHRRGALSRAARMGGAAAAQAFAILVAVVYMGGDWMMWWRLVAPALVPAALGVCCVATLTTRRGRAAGPIALAVVLGSVWGQDPGWTDRWHAALHGERLAGADRLEGDLTDAHRDLGLFLRARSGPDDLVAVNHAGAVPYYSELPTLDMTGLSDRHIARDIAGGLHHKFDPAYVLACRPRYIVLNTRREPTTALWYPEDYWEGETALFRHPDFARLYAPLPRFWSWGYAGGVSHTVVYERRTGVSGDPIGSLGALCWHPPGHGRR